MVSKPITWLLNCCRPHKKLKITDIYSPKYFGTENSIYSVLLGNDTIQCWNCNDQQYYNRECPEDLLIP